MQPRREVERGDAFCATCGEPIWQEEIRVDTLAGEGPWIKRAGALRDAGMCFDGRRRPRRRTDRSEGLAPR